MDERFVARPTCWLCGGGGRPAVAGARDDLFGVDGAWDIRECRPCGLAWVDPGPTPEGVAGLYASYSTHDAPPAAEGGFRGKILSGLRRTVFGFPDGASWMVRLCALLGSAVLPWRDAAGGTVMWQRGGGARAVLDVGCGAGEFLGRMRSYGWRAAGVEPDPNAASVAGPGSEVTVFVGSVEESPFPPGSFDVITLRHVVEHVLDPVATLKRCHELLKPGGSLAVVTPNAASLGRRVFGADWRGWEVPRHVNIFTPRALREVARRAGFLSSRTWTPTRAAPWFWRVARDRRRSRLGAGKGAGIGGRLAAEAFGIVEHWLSHVSPCGEEALIVARKAGRP